MMRLREILHRPAKLRYSVASATGPRQENQDNYLIREPNGRCHRLENQSPIQEQSRHKPRAWWRFAVTDGMGGHADGREIGEQLTRLLQDTPPARTPAQLRAMLLELHEQLYQAFHFRTTAAAAGTTLVIAEISPRGEAVIAHVGDSRIYRHLPGEAHWQPCTEDHVRATFIHRLNPTAPPPAQSNRNQPLAQALGYGSYGVFPAGVGLKEQYDKNIRLDLSDPPGAQDDVRTLILPPGSKLLLASDGIWHTHNPTTLPPTAETAQDFIRRAIADGARDNMTAICLQMA